MSGYKRMIWTVALVFGVTALSTWVNLSKSVFEIGRGDWKVIINAGIAAVVALAINAAAPWIRQYGFTGQPK